VIACRQRNLELVRVYLQQGAGGLAQVLLDDIKILARRRSLFRTHDSGDFFSQEYLDEWIMAARARPDLVFYGYTKSHHLDFSCLPANMRLVHSLGSKYDHLVNLEKPHAKVFRGIRELLRSRYTLGSLSDRAAAEGKIVRIGLVYHGSNPYRPNGFADRP
jgi:hypothetical protein